MLNTHRVLVAVAMVVSGSLAGSLVPFAPVLAQVDPQTSLWIVRLTAIGTCLVRHRAATGEQASQIVINQAKRKFGLTDEQVVPYLNQSNFWDQVSGFIILKGGCGSSLEQFKSKNW